MAFEPQRQYLCCRPPPACARSCAPRQTAWLLLWLAKWVPGCPAALACQAVRYPKRLRRVDGAAICPVPPSLTPCASRPRLQAVLGDSPAREVPRRAAQQGSGSEGLTIPSALEGNPPLQHDIPCRVCRTARCFLQGLGDACRVVPAASPATIPSVCSHPCPRCFLCFVAARALQLRSPGGPRHPGWVDAMSSAPVWARPRSARPRRPC